MNRRMFLGSVTAIAALPLVTLADKSKVERIRIKNFNHHSVTLDYPSERARVCFWWALADCVWPPASRVGEGAKQFEEIWGPWIRGESPTHILARGAGFFDAHCLKVAAVLKDQGIILEVIKGESVVTPKFETITETRATT